MKTPDEIMKGLKCCKDPCASDNPECPYVKEKATECLNKLHCDSIDYMRQLQDVNRALQTEMGVNRKPDTLCPANDQQAKADAGKPRLTLVPPRIIWDIAVVRQYGVEVKYPKTGVDGWRTIGMERIKDAAFRHFMRYLATPHGVDEESGLPHLWHLACNIAFLCELED